MSIHIDLEKLFYAFKNGANNVISNRQELNRINVFPVKDGDTGNNLASLMASLKDAPFGTSHQEAFESLADAALVGARGNSGIIFAQYINGFTSKIDHKKKISLPEFADASHYAAHYAKSAVETPVDGTIITLMSEWASVLKEYKVEVENEQTFFERAITHIETSLLNTKEQMALLKESNVVDAGAKGFVLFINGVVDYLIKGKEHQINTEEHLDFNLTDDVHIHNHLDYKYCSEFLIKHAKDTSDIKEKLKGLGDSMVVASSKTRTRIHIHTSEPGRVFDVLAEYGRVIEQKMDNMVIQNNVVENRHSDIAILTDSIADIPQDYIEEHQIHVINLSLLLEDVTYIDRMTITPKRISELARLKNEQPTSSLPNIKSVRNIFSYLKSYYKKVVVLTVARKLSGTYQLIESIAKDFRDDNFEIEVIDTKQNAGAEGLFVYEASRLVEKDVPFEEIVRKLKSYTDSSRILVAVKDIDTMVRSGRLTKGLGKVGKALNMKPIVTLNEGEGAIFGVKFSEIGVKKAIINHLKKLLDKEIISLNVVHIDALEGALEMRKLIEEETGLKVDYINETSSIIAAGAGAGAVAVSYITKQK